MWHAQPSLGGEGRRQLPTRLMRRTLEGLQNTGAHVAAVENLTNLNYADEIVLIFEEEKEQVFLDKLTNHPVFGQQLVWVGVDESERRRLEIKNGETWIEIRITVYQVLREVRVAPSASASESLKVRTQGTVRCRDILRSIDISDVFHAEHFQAHQHQTSTSGAAIFYQELDHTNNPTSPDPSFSFLMFRYLQFFAMSQTGYGSRGTVIATTYMGPWTAPYNNILGLQSIPIGPTTDKYTPLFSFNFVALNNAYGCRIPLLNNRCAHGTH
ncbi:hypothetical protein CLF_106717 [Clonorchis sinensis]|uniref:Uncharacterized protein n=1 Tax=Clonorchis sinensis TaxID=79923 RepID=G7YFK2_CLOSI|nr:hypothetical protein CLF_106717 [Clonorchis sinensis]